jgi:hypothetical protein
MAIINQPSQPQPFSVDEMDEAIDALEAVIEEAVNDEDVAEILEEIKENQRSNYLGFGR